MSDTDPSSLDKFRSRATRDRQDHIKGSNALFNVGDDLDATSTFRINIGKHVLFRQRLEALDDYPAAVYDSNATASMLNLHHIQIYIEPYMDVDRIFDLMRFSSLRCIRPMPYVTHAGPVQQN